jgi:hypothetical protein
MPGRDALDVAEDSEYAGFSLEARINIGWPLFSPGSVGIRTKCRSSDADVPTYKLPSKMMRHVRYL